MARIKSLGDAQFKVIIEEIAVPEWGDPDTTICYRNLASGEVSTYHSKLMQQPKDKAPHVTQNRLRHANAWLIILSACDESGDAIFTEQDISGLERLDNGGTARLVDAIQRLCKLGDYAETAEVLAGKSGTSQDSRSDYD